MKIDVRVKGDMHGNLIYMLWRMHIPLNVSTDISVKGEMNIVMLVL